MVNKTINRDSAGLRDAIFDELDALRSGQSSVAHAQTVARLAGVVLETMYLEIDAWKLNNLNPEGVSFNVRPLQLGAPQKNSA